MKRIITVLLTVLQSSFIFAAQATLPYTYSSGTTISATQVNSNEQELQSKYNAHDTAVTAVHGMGTSDIVGTLLTQALTNKTLTAPAFSGVSTGDLTLTATNKLRLDGSASGDTYLFESSANVLDLIVGGVTSGRFSTTDLGLAGSLTLGPTKKLYLDNGGDTYLIESSANVLDIYAGGTNAFKITATATTVNGAFNIDTTRYLNLDNGANANYITCSALGTVLIGAGGANNLEVRTASCRLPVGVRIGSDAANNNFDDASGGTGTVTMYIGNAAITVSSDKRLKENIEDTKLNALEKVNQLRVVDFNWNDPSDKCLNNRNARGKWTAMIAQEVVDVLPFVVNAPRPDGGAIDYDSPDIWQIEYANIVPILIKAMQEQQLQITELKARIEVLETK